MQGIASVLSPITGLKWSDDPDDLQRYGIDWTHLWSPAPCAVVWPVTVEQVRAVVRAAATNNLALVPSGGRTGLSGGAVAANGELIVSLEKMNRVLDFNAVERTLKVEAGTVLQVIQEAAAAQGLQYPIDLAARGSCTIGGNIATNAGGIRVLRYGNTREWVVGLTVVTAQGELLELNRGLIKNSSGYDLRHLMIGSEGTLGIVVGAELQLTEPLPASQVMLLALPNFKSVLTAFVQLRATLRLQAYEFLTDVALARVVQHGAPEPFDERHPYYVVAEFDDNEDAALQVFEQGVEGGWIADGALSTSDDHQRKFWHLRESITESIAPLKPYKNDISLRIGQLPAFLAEAQALFAERYPDFEVIWFGHIGDGNLHISIIRPADWSEQAFAAHCAAATKELAACIQRHGGSISAEHGIGLLKRDYLDSTRSDAEIAAMRAIKAALDPQGLLNPGKVFAPDRHQ